MTCPYDHGYDDRAVEVLEPIAERRFYSNDSVEVRARRVFDAIVCKARPVFDHYASDLVHDYSWIASHAVDQASPVTFFWSHRDWGTHIGTDRDLVARGRETEVNGVYRVDVVTRGERSDVFVTRET